MALFVRASWLLLGCILACHPALKQADRQQRLWAGAAPGALGERAIDIPRLYWFVPPPQERRNAVVIVASGGSYGHHGGLTPEAVPTARWLNDQGITAVVVRYRVNNVRQYNHEAFIADGRRAVRMVRDTAPQLGVSTDRLGVIGYSAGGHLASALATGCAGDRGQPDAEDPVERQSCEIDFAVIVYPVITLDPRHAHGRSRRNLLGGIDDPSSELVRRLSTDSQVTPATAPTIAVHSLRDRKVDPKNSELFYQALQHHGVDGALWLYPDGGHGVGLADDPRRMPEMSKWPADALAWLRARGLVPSR